MQELIHMNWKRFLKPTLGKTLLFALFLLIPIPLPSTVAFFLQAKYTPILMVPFLKAPTLFAYGILILIAICFYILAALVSNLYHRYVLGDHER